MTDGWATDDEEPSELDDLWKDYMSDDSHMGEGSWRDEYTDVYHAAEHFVIENEPDGLEGSARELDELLALPGEQDRRAAIQYPLHDIEDDEGALDAFLLALRARIQRELAGDSSRPLVDPRGPRTKPGPISPQGYDVSLPSAGSFDNLPIAQSVVDAVLQAYDDVLRSAFAQSQPGVTRRMPPMRMRFDREVGLVAVRDADPVRTRLAVVLLHDVGGDAHVFNSFPMEEVPEPPDFESLAVLFGGWLHADWTDDYPHGAWDPVEQVRRFAATEPLDVVEQAAYELEVVRSTGTEQDRRRAIRGMCCFFLPRPPGQLDAFLAEAAQVITDMLDQRRG